MAWTTPIYDRTYADAVYALENQDSASDLKGALNPSDLNRIEANIDYIVDELDTVYDIQVTLTGTIKTDWAYTDIPSITSDIDKIRNFILDIESTWAEWPNLTTITVGKRNLEYVDVNALEEHLYYLKEMLTLVAQYYKYNLTGNSFYAGQDQTYL